MIAFLPGMTIPYPLCYNEINLPPHRLEKDNDATETYYSQERPQQFI